MIGLYLHIPFCRSRCVYCNFYSTTCLDQSQRYVDAVCCEAAWRQTDVPIQTIYLGGGTPSQLSTAQLRQLFDTIYKYNKVETGAEITIECNPDDITETFAAALCELPVNRVSMGVQTFDDERLRFLHRRHTSSQVAVAVNRLRQAGIANISIDLMYGFPGETVAQWQHDISTAIALGVEHISTYCLMIEEGTPLYKLMNDTLLFMIDEETEREMYFTVKDLLETVGYEHYEISNFARPGFRSRHNSSYWHGTPYIGLGAAAHSYDITTRSWNVSDIHQYMEGIERGKRVYEEEILDEDTRYNDTITVALRTSEGLDLTSLSKRHRDYCLKNARRFINDGLMELSSSHLRLTRHALFVSDMVMSELMLV